MNAESLREELAALIAANAVVEERIKGILELARTIDAGDGEGAGRCWMRRSLLAGVSRLGTVS
jgi:hypothetical protein